MHDKEAGMEISSYQPVDSYNNTSLPKNPTVMYLMYILTHVNQGYCNIPGLWTGLDHGLDSGLTAFLYKQVIPHSLVWYPCY